MIDLETLAASCATMAGEIVARGSSDTFRYDAAGILEFGDSPEYYSPISSSAYRSEYPETAREYGYTREYLEQAERRLLACVIGYCALDSASMRLKTFFALSMPMAAPAGVQDGDETEGGKHYHRAAAPDDGGSAAEEE